MASPAPLSPAAMQIVAWLGEVGSRWGLPADACRVHALLFLTGQPRSDAAIADLLELDADQMQRAIGWLETQEQVEKHGDGWRTGTDPWVLMMRSLETRRAQELASARPVIDRWRREGAAEHPIVARQAQQLFALIDDIAAIDARTRFLSPSAARRLIGLGGRTARFLDRTIGTRTKR